jgi:AhpD family alkylhydroperoxidase
MTRIATPATLADAPEASRPLLEAVARQLGSVPNIALSPQALEGHVGLLGALSNGTLPAATRERIALAVAEKNGCGYCLSAHTYLGRTLAKLDAAEMTANRNGTSHDPKADAAVSFATKESTDRGHIADGDFAAAKLAAYTDAQVIEIVQHVALNTWTSFFDKCFRPRLIFHASKPAGPRAKMFSF